MVFSSNNLWLRLESVSQFSIDLKGKGTCRAGGKSWALTPARRRGDRSTFNARTMTTNSNTTCAVCIKHDVYKDETFKQSAKPGFMLDRATFQSGG